MNLIIQDDTFKQIMTCMGGSFLQDGDLEISYQDIKDTLIIQALQEYFKWYPIETVYNQDISGTFEIAFPTDQTFSVTDCRINTSRLGYGPYGNALVDERFIRSTGNFGQAMYGTQNDYGFTRAKIINKFEKQSFLESNKAFRWKVIENQRKVVGFSNVVGTLSITWASWSNDWQNISFSQQRDVIKLAQSYILRFFGDLRNQDSIDGAPIQLNGDKLVERADKLEDEVMEKWKNRTTTISIRG